MIKDKKLGHMIMAYLQNNIQAGWVWCDYHLRHD